MKALSKTEIQKLSDLLERAVSNGQLYIGKGLLFADNGGSCEAKRVHDNECECLADIFMLDKGESPSLDLNLSPAFIEKLNAIKLED